MKRTIDPSRVIEKQDTAPSEPIALELKRSQTMICGVHPEFPFEIAPPFLQHHNNRTKYCGSDYLAFTTPTSLFYSMVPPHSHHELAEIFPRQIDAINIIKSCAL